jgi:alpha-L-fucosidase 2
MKINPWQIVCNSHIPDPIDGSPLGNGDLGVMFWPTQQRLNFSLCKSNLWDTRLKGTAKQRSFFPAPNFQTIEKLVAEGKFDKIYELFYKQCAQNQSRWTLIPAGMLQILPKEAEIELAFWRQILDMQNGLVHLDYKTAQRNARYTSLVSSDYNVLAIEISCRTKQLPYIVDLRIGPNGRPEDYKFSYKSDQNSIYCRVQGYDNLDYYIGLRILNDGIRVGIEKDRISVSSQKSQNKVVALLTIASKLDDKQPLELMKGRLEKAVADGFKKIYKKHVQKWRTFWKSGSVDIPDAQIQRQHNLGLYLLGSCSSPNCQAPGLQGLWATNPNGSGWNDYTNDFNSQAYFWPAFKANKLNLLNSYFHTFKQMLPQVCSDTKKYYKMRGAAYPLCSSPAGEAAPGYVTHYHFAGQSAFIAQNYWWGYRYSRDKDFLKNIAYPVMKECGLFYLDRIKIDKKSGKGVIVASTSPEQGEGSYEAWGINPVMDIALIKELLLGLVESCNILQCDLELKRDWQDLLHRMPEYPMANGHLIELQNHEFKDSHRHGSVLVPIYPCSEMTSLSSPSLKKIARASLENFISRGCWLWEGYTYPWIALVASRLGLGQLAADYLKVFIGVGCLHRGGLHLNDDFTGSGKTAGGRKNFTLEGNTMYSAAVLEMLLQSHGGIIQIFPAIPDSWLTISFESLLAEGAFEVWAQRKKGRTAFVQIKSIMGGLCRVLDPYRGNVSRVVSKHKCNTVYKKGVISFETRANEYYLIKCK